MYEWLLELLLKRQNLHGVDMSALGVEVVVLIGWRREVGTWMTTTHEVAQEGENSP